MTEEVTTKPKILRIVLIVIAAIIVIGIFIAVEVLGVFVDHKNDGQGNNSGSSQTRTSTDTWPSAHAFVNENTGLITKYVDYGGTVTFSSDPSSTDTDVQIPRGLTLAGSDRFAFNDTVDVDGKPYPVSSSLFWYTDQESSYSAGPSLIAYFNKNVVNKDFDTATMLKKEAIKDFVDQNIHYKISEAKAKGTLPAVQYTLTGKSVITANDALVTDWVNRVPAWQAYSTINNVQLTGEGQYYYSFNCAIYDVTASSSELTQTLNTLFTGNDVHFNLRPGTAQITTETEQPCEVLPATDVPPAPTQGPASDYNPPAPTKPNDSPTQG